MSMDEARQALQEMDKGAMAVQLNVLIIPSEPLTLEMAEEIANGLDVGYAKVKDLVEVGGFEVVQVATAQLMGDPSDN